MNNGSDFDFIIIGSGAGGGTLAYHLAPSGKKILLLERGPFVPREKENWNSLEVNARGRYNTKELWRNADGSELHPHTHRLNESIMCMATSAKIQPSRDAAELSRILRSVTNHAFSS